MQYAYNKKRKAFGICLIISQLLTVHCAWGRSAAETTLDKFAEVQTLPAKKRTPKHAKLLVLDQPGGGEVQISATAGYTAGIYDRDFTSPAFLPNSYKIKSEATGLASQLTAAYGLTDNFYSKVSMSYGNSKTTQTTTNNGSVANGSESTGTSDGIEEPSILIGAQAFLGSTQLFGELSVDVSIGDRVEKRNSDIDSSDNNLRGGMQYSPHLGIVHDLGSALLMGGISYSVQDERNEKIERIGYTTTTRVKGGNSLNVVTGFELKKLMRWGFLLGYQKEDSKERTAVETNQVTSTPSNSQIVAATYMGIELGSSAYLIPKLSYVTTLDKSVVSNGTQIDINQLDVWSFNLGARVSF